MRVLLTPAGLRVGDEEVPLLSGSVHYWRIEPRFWRSSLEAVKAMGLRLVDVYVPWAVHEVAPGELELGQTDPQRDVVRFLKLAHDIGLLAIVRPGPHINAELTCFGIPERIVWDSRCQAKSPRGNPVILPAPPRMFPVPSYASEAYRDEVARYFELLGRALSPLRWPDGPIVLLQIDNEGAMFFRDGAYDQDYHPDALSHFREFLRRKYGSVGALARAYSVEAGSAESGEGSPEAGLVPFSDVQPPVEFAATRTDELARYLDWAEFHEQMLADTFTCFRLALTSAGLGDLPTIHNFPPAQETTPLNAARIVGAVDMIGLDYYGKATAAARRDIARRTSELAVHATSQGFVPFACEMGVGFPPFFPPIEERDSLFTALCALAYGLRAFNLYMAVDRDRWIGAPVDEQGRARPYAETWKKLVAAMVATDFVRLRRPVPVRLVMPRTERRLARVMHAFGPASGAVLAVMGKGPREGCLEDDLGLGYPVAVEAEVFLRSFEEALEGRGIPYAFVGGELKAAALEGASWVVCATSGGIGSELVAELAAALARGTHVTIGPRNPRFDGAWKPTTDAALLEGFDLLERHDPSTVDALVSRIAAARSLPRVACDPNFIHATAHEDTLGALRVVFVINAGAEETVARVTVGVDAAWSDALSASEFRSVQGVLELRMRRHTVRMLCRR